MAETVRRRLGSASPDPALVVDADLRPEGRNGPLVRTLESYRGLLRALVAGVGGAGAAAGVAGGGRPRPGRAFVELVDPVRYPADGLDQATVTEIRRIKARVDAERLPRGADRTLHTKLGLGGLADVEWTIQLLQLQHAGDLPELRTTSTLDGLREAGEAGLLSAEEVSELTAAWTLATRARNAVMLVRGKPGDQLPRSGRELAAVAYALGYPADGDPGCSSTTTAARRGAPAPSSSGCSTAGRPYPTDHSRGPRAQTAACCVVGRLEYARYQTALRLAGSRPDHEAHRP